MPIRRWLAATRVRDGARQDLRAVRSPVATAANARVVGMPGACMASPIRYPRSTGCGAALPSPRRENGFSPIPQGRCHGAGRAVDEFAQQQGAAIAELRREAARTGAGISLRQWLRQSRHGITGEHSEAGDQFFVGVQTELFQPGCGSAQQPRRGRADWARPRIHALGSRA